MGNALPVHRFLDAGEEPNQILVPIEGYEKKDLLPINDAVEPIKNLLYNLDVMIHTAIRNSEEPVDGLSCDESAAIHLYTMQWNEPHQSLYELLNRTLRSERRNELKPWFSYLKLVLTAMYKLPPLQKTIWRAIRGEVDKYYKKDKIWWGFSSCTETQTVTEQFIGHSGERTLFKINCISGRSIRSHSYFKEENEILLMPGTYLVVLKKWVEANGLHVIELQETEPPYQLITTPFSNQTIAQKLGRQKYYPTCDSKPKDLSQKHIQYIPRQLIGSETCYLLNAYQKCSHRDVGHVILCHAIAPNIQERWNSLASAGATTYIGFHTTLSRNAVIIARSDFRASMSPPQMLGFGIYFARASFSGKHDLSEGMATICAEIRMGRVLEITCDRICTVRNSNSWWTDYDTVYYNAPDDARDEFCIKDTAQILRWIIAVN